VFGGQKIRNDIILIDGIHANSLSPPGEKRKG
jgi:hypothetical protein